MIGVVRVMLTLVCTRSRSQIYKYDEGASSDTVTVYGSFGGLLMALTGNYRHLSNVTIGNNVYLLVR